MNTGNDKMKLLLVPDAAALQRKLANPPPLLGRLYARFQERLQMDAEFRRHHIFLPALLGDVAAIAEAKGQIFTLALNPLILAREQAPMSQLAAQDNLNSHAWCVAPRAMRLAVYYTWLDAHGAWSPEERRLIGTGLLDFFYSFVIPVLRARTPAGNNQQLSMAFCSALTGHAFAGVDGVSARAIALRDYALPKLRQTLGLMPASGYSGEGSTYQSDVVSGLVLWTGVFLDQLGEPDIWTRTWEPNHTCLSHTLRLETNMCSCGGLLPPWDQYGWARIHNLAARTRWAELSRAPHLLAEAEGAWDEEGFLAWRPDDRLWTLLYWPENESLLPTTAHLPPPTVHPPPSTAPSPLSGWSLPAVGAAAEHLPRKLRVLSVWDRCAGNLQGIGREQANPNHLIIDLVGEPITGDGADDGSVRLFSDASLARTLQSLSSVEQELIVQQYGSIERWACGTQQGFVGMSCATFIDGWESYFPRHPREGQLIFERREANRHTFAGEAAAFFQPAFDVSRMRRTVTMSAAGIVWVVDDLRAPSPHAFNWRLWLHRGVRQTAPQRVQLTLASGAAVTLAWLAEADGAAHAAPMTITTVPTFPRRRNRLVCLEQGSDRCDLSATGRRVRFVTCLVPEAIEELTVRQTAPNAWEATWTGGSDCFLLPTEIETTPDPEFVTGRQIQEHDTLCDLDETPFALLDEPDAALLAALADAPVATWRRTNAAMQTLTIRQVAAAMPAIQKLLLDPQQSYTVHSVAAWCLGRARYAPALADLRRMANIPEVNTAARARWGVERMAGGR